LLPSKPLEPVIRILFIQVSDIPYGGAARPSEPEIIFMFFKKG
jgi:hypothetical protein